MSETRHLRTTKMMIALIIIVIPTLASAGFIRRSAGYVTGCCSFVQGASHRNGATSSTTVAITLVNPVASGDMVAVTVGWANATGEVIIVTDDQGDTLPLVDLQNDSGDGFNLQTAYLLNIIDGAQTFTATFPGSRPFASILVDEFTGVPNTAVLDQHAISLQASAGTGTDIITSGSVTTTASGELVYGPTVNVQGIGIQAPGTGFAQAQNIAGVYTTEYLAQSAAGAIAATFTPTNSSNWMTAVMTFGLASSPPPPSSTPFTPLHTYFMSTTGNDGNNGLTTGTAWATPNHSGLVCGDVIIAAPGDYSGSWTSGLSSQPATCPSTSGGIDGLGGVWFAIVLCGGNVGTCHITESGTSGVVVDVSASNWAVEGWQVSSTSVGSTGLRSFEVDATASGTTIVHHVAFINDISTHSQLGFGMNDGALNHNVPGNGGDYLADIGDIAQNSNNDNVCLGAVDIAGPANFNTTAGVHVIWNGNFSYANQSTACTHSDVEGYIFDTFDAHGFVGTVVAKNNMGWDNGWAGMQVFMQTINSSVEDYEITQNTFFADLQCTHFSVGSTGELNMQLDGGFPWTMNVYNNIAQANRATIGCSGGGGVFGVLIGGASGVSSIVANIPGSGGENVFFGVGGQNTVAFNGFSIGTNITTSPSFANTTDLLTNWVGAPSCSSFTNVASCMGWNFASQTATANTPIADLAATAGGLTGKGYQPPKPCAPDAFYPTWLKGVVYLQWTGSSVTENQGLVNKPCGL